MTDARTDDSPTYRYSAAMAQDIELAWQARWDDAPHVRVARTRPARSPIPRLWRTPARTLRARHVSLPVGFTAARRPSARLHRHRQLRPLSADARPQRPVFDGLRLLSGSRPNSLRCRPASIRPSPPMRTSPICAASFTGSASATTSAAASPPPTPATTAGPSGSSSTIFEAWYDTDADKARPITELVAESSRGASDGRWASVG